ncbi:MAG: sulfur oxidation c-type cytochrome SoxA [Hyphomicrobiaceae bacterium]|nr:sulfur oxidation c-type cytochrome SoxA [Hyphomicrobiaceae bacterium]
MAGYHRRGPRLHGLLAFAACIVALAGAFAAARLATAAEPDAIDRGLESFRAMLKADPWSNPANLDVDRGAALWKEARGPRNASLERCDLGKGPGVVDGAYAELPRYFRDAGRVMDAETRILWCMERLQGLDAAAITKQPHPLAAEPVKDLGAIATWVASRSAGRPFAALLEHPRERATVALGEALFNRRMGPFDFSCASCHGTPGKRIRRQVLADLAAPEEARRVVGEWPAYRVSATHVMTLQHRLYDCFWQMRLPELKLGSEVSVALTAWLVKQAQGGVVAAPGLKR